MRKKSLYLLFSVETVLGVQQEIRDKINPRNKDKNFGQRERERDR